MDQQIKEKLSYDWKNIYRRLNANDLSNTGKVSMNQFENTLRQTNTFLSREDLNQITTQYGAGGFQ